MKFFWRCFAVIASALTAITPSIANSQAPRISPLQSAIIHYDAKTAESLLDEGADPNEGGLSAALIASIPLRNEKLLSSLLDHGADPNLPATRGTPESRALFSAADYGWKAGVELLLAHHAKVNGEGEYNPLIAAAMAPAQPFAQEEDKRAVMEILLDAGADVNFTMHGGYTAFSEAIRSGDIAKVKLLEKHKATHATGPFSPVEWAILSQNPDMLRYIISQNYLGDMGNAAIAAKRIEYEERDAREYEARGADVKRRLAAISEMRKIVDGWRAGSPR